MRIVLGNAPLLVRYWSQVSESRCNGFYLNQHMRCSPLYELHDLSSFTLSRITQESRWMISALIMLHWLLFCCLKVNGKAFWAAGDGEVCASLRRPDLHFGKCTWFSGGLAVVFTRYWWWTFFVVEDSPVLLHTSCNTVAVNSYMLKTHVQTHSCSFSNYKYIINKFNILISTDQKGFRFVVE